MGNATISHYRITVNVGEIHPAHIIRSQFEGPEGIMRDIEYYRGNGHTVVALECRAERFAPWVACELPAAGTESLVCNFADASWAMLQGLVAAARADRFVWKKDAIAAPNDELIVVEVINSVNEVIKVFKSSTPTKVAQYLHGRTREAHSRIMHDAGFVLKTNGGK